MAAHAIDVDEHNFQTEVIEASRRLPVVVDYWAPWCNPCKALKPILEKLAEEFQGRFRLAKIDTEANPQLAQLSGVRSIPDVRVFRDGQVVDGFTGAMPEGLVRRFIETLLPSPSEEKRLQARAALQTGDAAMARDLLAQALELDPENDQARMDLAERFLDERDAGRADEMLAAVTARSRQEDRYKTLADRLAILQGGAQAADEAELRARIDARPNDLDAWLQLAQLHAARHEYEPAFDAALEVVKRDRSFNDGAGRKLLVSLFNLAPDAQLVSRYRKLLASTLN